MTWTLPQSLEVGGAMCAINADYRDILGIIQKLNDEQMDWRVRAYVALALFYKDFDTIEEKFYSDALNGMFSFISCGEEEDGKPRPKTIDWEQDHGVIVSEINKAAGFDVRGQKFLHWFTFISYFNNIGDGPLALIVSIREKIRKGKKLEKWEKEYYSENRSKIDFRTKYTDEDMDFFKHWSVS